MDNILIISRGWNPDKSSGVLVLQKIVNELKKSHNIDVFTIFETDDKYEDYFDAGVRIIRNRAQNNQTKITEVIEGIIKGYYISNFLEIKNISLHISKLLSRKHYDYVFSFCFPFDSILSVSLVRKKNFKWCCFYFDPYFTNYIYHSKIKRYLRYLTEKKAVRKADYLFLLESNYSEYLKAGFLNAYKFRLPNLENFEHKPKQYDICFEKQYINFVYTGALYKEIRNPEALFRIWVNLPYNYRLYIIGDRYGFDSDYFDCWKEKLKDRICIYDRCSKEIINGVIEQADYLIDIANTIDNQLPGKTFDYISSGKPIILFSENRKSASLDAYQKYPLFFYVDCCRSDNTCSSACDGFEEFVKENYGNRTPYSTVSSLYSENTQEQVIKDIFQIINTSK